MWLMGTVAIGNKSKLKHSHTGKTAVFNKSIYLRRYVSKVFCNYKSIAGSFFQYIHKLHTGSFNPASVFGCGRFCRHSPEGFYTTEMVNSHRIKHLRHVPYAILPPFIAIFFHNIPVVKRIAPQLTILGKIVRRNAGNFCRFASVIQKKLRSVTPYITAIQRHIYGDISHYFYAF